MGRLERRLLITGLLLPGASVMAQTPGSCVLQSIDVITSTAAVSCDGDVLLLRQGDEFGEFEVEAIAGDWVRLRSADGGGVRWGLGAPGEPARVETYEVVPGE